MELKPKAKAESSPALMITEKWKKLDRTRDASSRRMQVAPHDRYSRSDPGHLYSVHDIEATMASLLRAAQVRTLRDLRILDVGCGRGSMLRLLLDHGARPEHLFGIDLLEQHVSEARYLSPNLNLVCGNGSHLPFSDASFDLIFQCTLFTSVVSDSVKQSIANEILRTLTPEGRLLWYDLAYNSPSNPAVRGIGRAEIRRLFPGCSIVFRRVTLAPPLGRIVGRVSPALYNVLAMIRPLCTHYMCLLQKP